MNNVKRAYGKAGIQNPESGTGTRTATGVNWETLKAFSIYLTIIPRARMGYESIAHEAEGRVGY